MNTERNFSKLLRAKYEQGKNLCIGLDPVEDKLPSAIRTGNTVADYRRLLFPTVTATPDIAGAYKPNWAFFLEQGPDGMILLHDLIEHIKKVAPSVPVILDAKIGDIDKSNLPYVRLVFDYFKADAVTVHPTLGGLAMKPFWSCSDKGVFVLARTSNEGAGEFQDLCVNGSELNPPLDVPVSLSEAFAHNVAHGWNQHDNCGIVAGATNPGMVQKLRWKALNMNILIPGIGTQEGDLEGSIKGGRLDNGHGFLVNVSSGITQASKGEDFESAAYTAALGYHQQIQQFNKPQ